MILGDSLVAMTSLLEKERLAGQVQMVYMDPPYGINYKSNFQRRVTSTRVGDRDTDLTREPEQIRAYRDTWQLQIHSYLSYVRDRLFVAHELLSESGSIFFQIGEDNAHMVRSLLDEIFGRTNFLSAIAFAKTSGKGGGGLDNVYDTLFWYAKSKVAVKIHQLFRARQAYTVAEQYTLLELSDGRIRPLTREEISLQVPLPGGSRRLMAGDLSAQSGGETTQFEYSFEGRGFRPPPGAYWKTTRSGLDTLATQGRLHQVGNRLRYKRYEEDFPASPYTDIWEDTVISGFASPKVYAVQTSPKVVERCIQMATDPGDLVLDPTSGSGTTAFVSEKHGRRWIAIDTSRVAIAVARERLLTSAFPYYQLTDEQRGVDHGIMYETLNRVTLRSLVRGEEAERIVLFDSPIVDASKVRVSGPFSLEALSRYATNPLEEEPFELATPENEALDHVTQLLDALGSHGIPRREAKSIKIETLQRLTDVGPLQAEGTFGSDGTEKRFSVSLGPRFGAITPRQIDEALAEAYGYDLVVFVGFAAHAEAQQMLAKGRRGRYEVALLMANPDLLVGDLLKATSSSQTFRLFSAPDIRLKKSKDDEHVLELLGVDSYDASTGKVTAASRSDIAAWFLDRDYDGMVFHVSQAFFPKTNGWEALQRALKGTIDPALFEQLESFESLPFKAGENNQCAIRVITDDGNASEAILDLITGEAPSEQEG